jgi:uncharacterized damage-inducible protein DinB
VLVDAGYFRTLFDYQYWARDRLLAAAKGISAEEWVAPNGFSYDGLKPLLTHMLGTEIAWLNRMRGPDATPVQLVSKEEGSSLETLVTRWAEVESTQLAFLAGLKDEDLGRRIEYRFRDGSLGSATIWEFLTIVYTHSVQHRSEAAEALTLIGRSPGNLDYVIYMREKG